MNRTSKERLSLLYGCLVSLEGKHEKRKEKGEENEEEGTTKADK